MLNTVHTIVSSILGVIEIHQRHAYFLKHGFRMGIVQYSPLTIWIKHVGPWGIDREVELVYLPHALSIFGKNKAVFGKHFEN